MTRDWFTFQDVLKWYVLRRIAELSGQMELARLMGVRSSKAISAGLHDTNDFRWSHLESICQNISSVRHSDILLELLEISREMESGVVNKEMLEQRLAVASQRGPKGNQGFAREGLDGKEFRSKRVSNLQASLEEPLKKEDR